MSDKRSNAPATVTPQLDSSFSTVITHNLRTSVTAFAFVFWLTIPLLVGIKLIEQFVPLLALAGEQLGPLMQTVGLPGQTGIVWAAAILIQPLASLALLAENWHTLQLTTAQATILGILMLEAHAILIEVRLAQHLGMRAWFNVVLRFGTALGLGALLNYVYLTMHWLQEPAGLLLVSASGDATTWLAWLTSQLHTWLVFFVVIFGLNLLMHYLRVWKIERSLAFLLKPLMRLLGIHHSAATVTIIGLALGLTFGAAMLLSELHSGRISRRDMFLSVATLSICHSLLEDTLLTLLFGAHLSGVLFARIIFAIAVIAMLSRLLRYLPVGFGERWLMTPAPSRPTS